MRGIQPVELPTKPYIKKYLENQFGESLKLTGDSPEGMFLFSLMDKSGNDEATDFASIGYTVNMKVQLPAHVYHQRGKNLNKTNIKRFNRFIESIIKTEVRFWLNFFINDKQYSLDDAIDTVQVKMNLREVMAYDTIKKDYYRYRERKNLPMLKGDKTKRTCPLDLLLIEQYQYAILAKTEEIKTRTKKKFEQMAIKQSLLFEEPEAFVH